MIPGSPISRAKQIANRYGWLPGNNHAQKVLWSYAMLWSKLGVTDEQCDQNVEQMWRNFPRDLLVNEAKLAAVEETKVERAAIKANRNLQKQKQHNTTAGQKAKHHAKSWVNKT